MHDAEVVARADHERSQRHQAIALGLERREEELGRQAIAAYTGQSEAASYAAAAIELCETHGSPEQLAASLPTAAMVASWEPE